MATQTIQFAFLTGQTPTVKLFADDGSDTVLATPTATEATNRTGVYTFTQTDRTAGNYLITVAATGINAEYVLTLTLADATFYAVERPSPKLEAIHAKLPTRDYLCGSTVNSGAIDTADRAAISDAVWDDTTDEHTTAGTFGLALQSPATAASMASLVATVGPAGAGLTAIPWNAAWDAEVQSEVVDALNQALTESYAAAGSTASVAQMLYMIQQHLGSATISSTTKTVKKLDGSTTAGTFTLDSATDPTTIARAT